MLRLVRMSASLFNFQILTLQIPIYVLSLVFWKTYFIISGYKVITFKNPYLGNTCVPFMHWTCSLECAKALEVPARHEQIQTACMLDSMYEQYIVDCQRQFGSRHQQGFLCPCVTTSKVNARPKHSCNIL